MSSRYEGKVVIITGAGSGLGQSAALKMAKEGAKLSLVDLNSDSLEATKALILEVTPQADVLLVTADVSDEEAVKNYVDGTVKTFGRIDAFYNNAGIEGKQAPLAEYDSKVFNKVTDININGVFYGMKYVLPIMKEQGSGSVLNVASVGGIRAIINQAAYVASKHAVTGLTKSAAVDYGQYGISVNAIAPGVILTAMVEGSFKQIGGDNWEQAMADFVSVNPKKRFGKPEEVANVVAFLLSGEAEFVNGQVIAIDGGQSSNY
ncbi:glucose 1-dehydrogenase [Alkalicoccobacillus murimartini]|jgi:NAD(P)-dependent dehydrogenase (short-subunit alcohol dehydrogenase family)|uniref:NAD(P)-dependent dehydrogenase (Short-subunit alcohol dehydrogenase family) n=1 Tax=Alkalicoccobacillus murimartini TaxID=171685 RepID=A0ABT9YIS9_9BACI|nr:glucose 1-dehydrogenase [Alkalicoccobacillus murimartini]MDQ0207594.1 NAD(P)-dependent dehydrogenase (short-subunit alcohol dehydrogenase family) [Alkalicoccobacillus murimartini]